MHSDSLNTALLVIMVLTLGSISFVLVRRPFGSMNAGIAKSRKAMQNIASSRSDEAATRESWKILPPPTARTDLGFAESYATDEFERMRRGLIPRQMEDRWFIYFEEPWLYFHRSWTGPCIYAIRFESLATVASAVESWVSRDSTQYRETRTDYDRAIAKFLIDAFLLRKRAAFPVPSSLPVDTPKGLYQHSLVGRAYPEAIFPDGPPRVAPFWTRIRRLLRKRWDLFR